MFNSTGNLLSTHDGDGLWQFWPIWRPDVRRAWTLSPSLTSSKTGKAEIQLVYWVPGRPSTQKWPWWHFKEWQLCTAHPPTHTPSRWPCPSPTAATLKCWFTCGQLKDPFHHTATGGAPGPVGWPWWSRGEEGWWTSTSPPEKPFNTHTIPRQVRPRSPAFRTSAANEVWKSLGEVKGAWPPLRKTEAGRGGGHRSTAALITSDVNPQNNVQESGSPGCHTEKWGSARTLT